jgi:hypothetical protein
MKLDKKEKEAVRLAAKALQATLVGDHYVGSGYGYGDGSFNKEPCWFITIYSNDNTLQYPKTWQGYPVFKRDIPRAL